MANLEVIALDTVTPQLKAPQAGDGYAMPRPVTVTEVVGSTALTLTGATQTTAVPVLNATQTWNNVSTTFTAAKINATDTASGANSLLIDLQQSGTTRFGVIKDGALYASNAGTKHFNMYSNGGGFACSNSGAVLSTTSYNAILTGHGPRFANDVTIQWSSASVITAGGGSPDLVISRKTTASLQFGSVDAAAPVAQTIGPQSVVAGTSNTAGQNFTVRGSQGTGTGAGGDIIFQVASAGSSGTAQNALATAMRVYNTKTVAVGSAFTVATLPAAGTQGRRAWVTDALAPAFLGALTGGGAVVTPVFDNGTAWVAG